MPLTLDFQFHIFNPGLQFKDYEFDMDIIDHCLIYSFDFGAYGSYRFFTGYTKISMHYKIQIQNI